MPFPPPVSSSTPTERDIEKKAESSRQAAAEHDCSKKDRQTDRQTKAKPKHARTCQQQEGFHICTPKIHRVGMGKNERICRLTIHVFPREEEKKRKEEKLSQPLRDKNFVDVFLFFLLGKHGGPFHTHSPLALFLSLSRSPTTHQPTPLSHTHTLPPRQIKNRHTHSLKSQLNTPPPK